MKEFHIEIVTPDGLRYSDNVESLLVRTDDGDVEILAGHTDLLAAIDAGRARILKNGKPIFAAVSGGFISVTDGKVRLCVITFEFADEIDLARAKAAKESAEQRLKSAKDDRDERIVKAKIARATSRINVANLK